jgi:hypothetical protein
VALRRRGGVCLLSLIYEPELANKWGNGNLLYTKQCMTHKSVFGLCLKVEKRPWGGGGER